MNNLAQQFIRLADIARTRGDHASARIYQRQAHLYSAEWDESKHPRANDGKFGSSGNVAGKGKEKPPRKWEATEHNVSRRADGLPDPGKPDGIRFIAKALRLAMFKANRGDSANQCIDTAEALRHFYPEAETWFGYYEGNEEQAHTIMKLGGKYLDVTADQFGGKKIAVYNELPKREYRRFQHDQYKHGEPSRHPDVMRIVSDLRSRIARKQSS